jgi:hypothetical protein
MDGFRRRVPTFGNIEYAHSWVTRCFLAPGREPAFVLPRMVVAFDLPEGHRRGGEVAFILQNERCGVDRRSERRWGGARLLLPADLPGHASRLNVFTRAMNSLQTGTIRRHNGD